ncbi:MAG: ABC transporter permease [Bryobacteraceae bacterium]
MSFFSELTQDARFALRQLRANPATTLVAVGSLALGIMAATAIYSAVYGVVLEPFPYKDVDSLASVNVRNLEGRGGRVYYEVDQFLTIAERSHIFNGVIASTISDLIWTGQGEPQRLRGNHGSGRTFEVMGVPPLHGRWYTEADLAPGAPEVCVLGYKFWQRQFAGDPSAIGRELKLNGVVRTVVGIMPKRFMWRGADVYVPLRFERGKAIEGVRYVHVLGRVKPGVTPAQAEADLQPVIEELAQRQPGAFPKKWRAGLLSFKETFPSAVREQIWILFAAAFLLLAIACANVSNLLLAKGAGRGREIAVRAAIGAGRWRLFRQLLTESAVLGLAGGILGAALAVVALRGMLALVPPDTIPDEAEVTINLPVLGFALALSMVTTLVFGLVPAFGSSRGLANPLRERGAANSAGRWIRNGLVVAEVALSIVLLVSATLMMRTLVAVQAVELGFRPDRVLSVRVPLNEKRYPDAARRTAFSRQLLERVRTLPGVVEAAVSTGVHPFGGWSMPVEIAGAAAADQRPVVVHQISANYPKAMGIALLQGRALAEDDVAGARRVALVNQAFVQRYLSGRDALGAGVRLPRLAEQPIRETNNTFEVVGVVRDTLNRGVMNEVLPELYFPYSIIGAADQLVLFTRGDPNALAPAVRKAVIAIDAEQPVTEAQTLAYALDTWVFGEVRFVLVLFGVFAVLGLALAAVGVYGVISHSVSQRTHEVGVRMALGATVADILRMVVSSGLRLVLIGAGLGIVGSIAAARVLKQLTWKASATDPVWLAGVATVMLGVGLAACYWPARRAARVDPAGALRAE